MELMTLILQHFRSYKKQQFSFSPSLTLIIGPNTSGKTNILESIYSCATGKSFRAEKDSDMIEWGEDVSRITAQISNSPASPAGGQFSISKQVPKSKEQIVKEGMKLELVLTTGTVQGERAPMKKYLVNGVARRHIDFAGHLNTVLFSPEDLDLVTDTPSLRRAYLNSVLVQTDREYRRNLLSYERGLRQRNKLLFFINDGKAQRSQLLFWNQLLIKTGSYLTESRRRFIESVNGFILDALLYRLVYDPSIISQARLDQYKDEEVGAKTTLVGPQRDDFRFEKAEITNDKLRITNEKSSHTLGSIHQKNEELWRDVSRFGSRGEQRLAILWLKLAELEFIEKEVGERPILLLDDIFSELDLDSRKIVLSVIEKQQTIITSAEFSILEELPLKKAALIRL